MGTTILDNPSPWFNELSKRAPSDDSAAKTTNSPAKEKIDWLSGDLWRMVRASAFQLLGAFQDLNDVAFLKKYGDALYAAHTITHLYFTQDYDTNGA